MAAPTNGGSKDAAISARETELMDRLIACAAGLPRICALKRCRRAKRCLGEDLVCLHHHRGLVRARYGRALKTLGWAPTNEGPAK